MADAAISGKKRRSEPTVLAMYDVLPNAISGMISGWLRTGVD